MGLIGYSCGRRKKTDGWNVVGNNDRTIIVALVSL